MHSTSPGRTRKLTPFTACTVASRVTKRTLRSFTSASGSVPFAAGSDILKPAVTRGQVVHVAGHDVRLRSFPDAKRRIRLLARRLGERATGMETTARGRIDRVRRIAGDRRLLDPPGRVHRRARRQEGARIGMKRLLEDRIDRANLDRTPEIHHQD